MNTLRMFLLAILLVGVVSLNAAEDAAPAPAAGPVAPSAAPAAPTAGPVAPAATGSDATAPAAAADPAAAAAAAAGTGANPAGTAATAVPKPAQQQSEGLLGSLGTMVPMLLIFGFFFYFMLIRPEQKRRKEHESMLNTIKKGTTVLTASGLYGTVQDVQGDTVLVTIDQNNKVTVKMQKSFVNAVIGAGGTAPAATPAAGK